MQQTTYQFGIHTPVTYQAAQKIVPIITDWIGIPESVIDLGGGGGGWLKAFKEAGAKKVCCIAHPSIQPEDLLISVSEFMKFDLSKEIPDPIPCDLAISTEFAEHVPTSKSDAVVDFLTKSSRTILFSAAIPKQGGYGHINEQRPAFWQKLYEERGYKRIDIIRPQIIFDQTIPSWFRQNLYLYIDQTLVEQTKLASVPHAFIPDDFELVYTGTLNQPLLELREIFKGFVPAVLKAIDQQFQVFNSKRLKLLKKLRMAQ
ncbi:MAG TPA: hypothetical protein DDW76_27265 [Cyanobacteria bacterium UBA11369]|nr:hypothetical protein [Cyanobacteria bacterium UBA11371]HBE52370.1 hypothetical protein [Cyanobacteria bacterium UBA11369]